ncbi:MAG TPA: RidA family protein [Vicinamibacteria bacterium]|nr:RidA family protein [Vicinamibacteria bacterium]
MGLDSKRRSVGSGVSWEEEFGYSRAVRVGDRIFVSGTTATGPDGVAAPGDAAGQAHFVLDKIESAIVALGGTLSDVVRTRVFVARLQDWSKVAAVHGERFRGIRPANTLVRADLIGEEYLVEIEAEAVVGSAGAE